MDFSSSGKLGDSALRASYSGTSQQNRPPCNERRPAQDYSGDSDIIRLCPFLDSIYKEAGALGLPLGRLVHYGSSIFRIPPKVLWYIMFRIHCRRNSFL
jgi:hypothetical protein